MITTLTVWNFALIAHAEINFSGGLNILTGETGAGKSILIDAVGACIGHRLSTDMIRSGCDWLRVEAVFDITGQTALIDYLNEEMIDLDGNDLIVTRQLTTKGKSSVLVNGCRTTAGVLKKIGEFLFDIHGQNENLAILRTENKFRLVDGTDAKIAAAFAAYREIRDNWQEVRRNLDELTKKIAAAAERKDVLSWQADEIDKINPQVGEDEKLEREVKKLSSVEKITEDANAAAALLNGGGENAGVVSALSEAVSRLEHLSRYDDCLDDLIERLEEDCRDISDALERISDYCDTLEFDPRQLDKMMSRLDRIDRLRKKYGAPNFTIADIIKRREAIAAELSLIETGDDEITDLKNEEAALLEKLKAAAKNLSDLRRAAAAKISEEITSEIRDLGMRNAYFSCVLTNTDDFGENGTDEIEILFNANASDPLKPLERVASGGELSRIALAIKSAAVASDSVASSMVFDEIDTGIGGRTAQMVAARIARVACRRQVLCITHLAAIASMADRHLYLAKAMENGAVTTTVTILDENEKISEIARMISGLDENAAALASAKEMLKHAKAEKEKFTP